MAIRNFQAGDEAVQVGIYNEAAAELPRFKPAALPEVRRRCQAADFDPLTRFFAIEDGRVVGYATFHANGRVSFPWCRKGHEAQAAPLFEGVLQAMKARGVPTAFAAYRGDWAPQRDFFLAHNFRPVREMINFVLDLADMPTPAAQPNNLITPIHQPDMPSLLALGAGILRVETAGELEQHLLHNPYFHADAVFVLRSRTGGKPVTAGVLVERLDYADPRQVDSAMPCFRLGAFGTEGMQVKRINGVFSFLAAAGPDLSAHALDLMSYVVSRLEKTDVQCLAAQVASDVPHLAGFYQRYFRKQGSFPVFERTL